MKTRMIGNIEVSEIGMGCMGFSHGYGQIPEREYSIQAIQDAYHYGCTFFDTAETYGSQLYYLGHNEEILGEAVKDFRDKVVIATKFHLGDQPFDTFEDLETSIRKHLSESMKRLQTNYVDLYYLHRVNLNVPVEDVAKVMGHLIDDGLIRGWGLSQVDKDTIEKAHNVTPLSAVQNIYNMLERGIEDEVIPYCLEHHIGIVPFSPVASGFLSGNVKADTKFEKVDDVRVFVPQLKQENIEGNMPIVELISKYAEELNATNAQIALSWMINKYPNIVPIPGSKNKGRIMENLKASEVNLSEDQLKTLDDALNKLEVHGHRGFVQFEGGKMSDWGKK